MITEFEKQLREEQKNWIPIQNGMIRAFLIRTCTNCDRWDSTEQICNNFKTLPPPNVIVTGCEEWEYLVPF